MLDTVVSKENCIRAAADGDVATLRRFFSQYAGGDNRLAAKDEAPNSPKRVVPTIQWHELATTLFREAIENGQLDIVRVLLETPTVVELYRDPVAKAKSQSEWLAWAISEDYPEIVSCLLKHGTDPNVPLAIDGSDNGDTLPPLSLAARLGSLEIAEILVQNGADVNARREADGSMATHEAARQDEHEMIQYLVANGGDINARDDATGETSLHVAVKRGSKQAVRALIRCRATLGLTNKRGSTAVHIARAEGQREIVELLTAAGAT